MVMAAIAEGDRACTTGVRRISGLEALGRHTWGMDRFVVTPNGPLAGTVRAGGAKNSVLKLMAACLLAEGRHVLTNVPRITDVDIMGEVLGAMGVDVARGSTPDELVVTTPSELLPEAPYELVEKMRASVVVLGPLLTRMGRATVSMPGGDDFGPRPIDMHLHALESLGASFASSHGNVVGRVASSVASVPRLVGTRVVLEYPSHTGTDNVVMAATLAKGTTVIENAAREPEVSDLAEFLNSMGAQISGAGTSRIEVEGVDALHPATHAVIPDRLVVATFLAAAGLTAGEVIVEDGRPDHMDMLLRKLAAMGIEVTMEPEGLRACRAGSRRLTPVDVATLPYPGFATDYKPLLVALLTVADGVGIVTENLFFGRFRYIEELRRMGADIRTQGHHAVVRGVERLSGAPVRAFDVRAGAALVLAGLVADGETVITDAHHVDRGYEDFDGKLASLGARVRRD
jgi:UDP-N-acetylglucosamine 1-carboxyvinyltransferase